MDTPRLPPGPRFAPLQTLRFVRDINATFADCLRRYGDPFLLPLLFGNAVITAHPDGIKEIFTADPDTFESFASAPLEPLVGQNSLLLISGARHKRERKLLLPPFHGERMRAYGQLMQESVFAHMSRFRPGERVVIQELTQAVAFDVILRAVFGVEEPERIERFHRNNEALMAAVSPAFMFFKLLRHPALPGWRRLLAAQAEQDAILQEQIERRRRSLGSGEDILGLLLTARDEAGQPMTDRELKDELITLVAAGHDTSALSLTWSMFRLHRDPGCLTKLLDEIDALGEDPEPAVLAKLPYLGAVCDETLRMNPPLNMCARRLLRPFRLRGWDLPVGTVVAAAITATHKDPSIYPEPLAFRPERFLEGRFSPFEYLPFGGGARRCIGAAFAAYELRIVLGSLLARHRFSLISSVTPRQVRRHVTLQPEGGVPMIYEGPRRRA